MRNAHDHKQKPVRYFGAPLFGETRRQLKLALAILFSVCATLTVLDARCISAEGNEQTPSWLIDSLKSRGFFVADYSKFSHSRPGEHAALTGENNCASCHRPNGVLEPSFPEHKDCIGCHLVEFTAANSASATNPICTICHNEKALNSPQAPLKEFSPLRSFTAEFDHAQHLKGIASARPERGCAFCHAPARGGVAETMPARLDAHRICFECHASGKPADKLSACGSCHGRGSYSPTSTNARSYRMSFSHAAHARATCQGCHNVKGRGLPQARQVSSIRPIEHVVKSRAPNCKACHNLANEREKSGQRAFGDRDTHFCKRCHKGETFSF